MVAVASASAFGDAHGSTDALQCFRIPGESDGFRKFEGGFRGLGVRVGSDFGLDAVSGCQESDGLPLLQLQPSGMLQAALMRSGGLGFHG